MGWTESLHRLKMTSLQHYCAKKYREQRGAQNGDWMCLNQSWSQSASRLSRASHTCYSAPDTSWHFRCKPSFHKLYTTHQNVSAFCAGGYETSLKCTKDHKVLFPVRSEVTPGDTDSMSSAGLPYSGDSSAALVNLTCSCSWLQLLCWLWEGACVQ